MIRTLVLAATLIFLSLPAVAVPISPTELRQVVSDYLKLKGEGSGVELRLADLELHGPTDVANGKREYEVVAPQQWSGWGSAGIALVVRVNGQVSANIPARVRVEALADAVVTIRPLERGAILRPSDLAIRRVDLTAGNGKQILGLDEAVGMRLKTAIKADATLRQGMLEKVQLVKSGQVVTMVVGNDLLQATTSGMARGSGGAGDIIMVQNLSSRREVMARIVEAGRVMVAY
jgi:flagella basal body P-ring formation protein FlgA